MLVLYLILDRSNSLLSILNQLQFPALERKMSLLVILVVLLMACDDVIKGATIGSLASTNKNFNSDNNEDCQQCRELVPTIGENCFTIRSKWLLVQNCSINSHTCTDRSVGQLAGRCVAATHFEYPHHNCSLPRNDISTHLCFSGFNKERYAAKYHGGM